MSADNKKENGKEELERLFSQHFVKTEIFEKKDAKFLATLAKYRETADYNSSFEFIKEDFDELREDAKLLIKKIHAYLKLKKFIK